ncbi:POTRA domain-containing protein, partial [Achromobacter ruhlandii]|uniref:POTRA domain-containing protein n=1 Tax=Achromobacter ruhlandii TaxID=72557 RepID=UPI0024B5DD34
MRRLSEPRRPAVHCQPPSSLRAGLAAVLLALAAGPVAAQNVPIQLPSGAEPGRQLPQPVMPESTPTAPPVTVQQGGATEAPAGADKLTFTLTDMRIEGITRYPADTVRPLYQDLIGKTITVADAFKVANDIELRYRNDGYVTPPVLVPAHTIPDSHTRTLAAHAYVTHVPYHSTSRTAQPPSHTPRTPRAA